MISRVCSRVVDVGQSVAWWEVFQRWMILLESCDGVNEGHLRRFRRTATEHGNGCRASARPISTWFARLMQFKVRCCLLSVRDVVFAGLGAVRLRHASLRAFGQNSCVRQSGIPFSSDLIKFVGRACGGFSSQPRTKKVVTKFTQTGAALEGLRCWIFTRRLFAKTAE